MVVSTANRALAELWMYFADTGLMAMLAKKKISTKVLPHKPAQLNDGGVDAQTFTNEPASLADGAGADRPAIGRRSRRSHSIPSGTS